MSNSHTPDNSPDADLAADIRRALAAVRALVPVPQVAIDAAKEVLRSPALPSQHHRRSELADVLARALLALPTAATALPRFDDSPELIEALATYDARTELHGECNCGAANHRDDSKRRVVDFHDRHLIRPGRAGSLICDPAPMSECKEHVGYGVMPERTRVACQDYKAKEPGNG